MEDLQASEESAFVQEDVSAIIKEAIETVLMPCTYQHTKVPQWTNNVIEGCMKTQGPEQTVQVHRHFSGHAEKWRRAAHSDVLLLGQHERWERNGPVGEQDHVLHHHCVWSLHIALGEDSRGFPVRQRQQARVPAESAVPVRQ